MDKEIVEGNKLIAEFMGFIVKHTGFGNEYNVILGDKAIFKRYTPSEKLDNPTDYFLSLCCDIKNTGHFKYHTSWDWLMEVVEKINKTALDNYGEMGVYIYPNMVTIGENEHDHIVMITIANHPTLKEMVWLAVKTFINWYNTQNSKSVLKTKGA